MGDSRYSAHLTYIQAVLTTLLATTVEAWGFNRDHYTENGVDGIINITVPQLLPPSKRELLARILQRLQDGLTNGPWREIWVIGDSSLDRKDIPMWLQYHYNGTTSGFEDRDDDEEFLGETRWVVEKNPFGGEIFLSFFLFPSFCLFDAPLFLIVVFAFLRLILLADWLDSFSCSLGSGETFSDYWFE